MNLFGEMLDKLYWTQKENSLILISIIGKELYLEYEKPISGRTLEKVDELFDIYVIGHSEMARDFISKGVPAPQTFVSSCKDDRFE